MKNRDGTMSTITMLFIAISAHILVISTVRYLNYSILLNLSSLFLYLPLFFEYLKGKLRFFNPLLIANISLYIMFVARPIDTIYNSNFDYSFSQFNIQPYYTNMLIVSCLAIASLQVGFYFLIPWMHTTFKSKQDLQDRHLTNNTNIYISLLIALGLFLFLLFALKSGGIGLIFSVLGGRKVEDAQLFVNSNGYLYDGILILIPASLLSIAQYTIKKDFYSIILFIFSFVPIFIFLSSRGTRSNLLPLVLAILIFYTINLKLKPRPLSSIILIYLALSIGINFLRDIRTSGISADANTASVLINSLTSPDKALLDIVESPDSEMADALAIEIAHVPSNLSFQPGAIIRDLYIRAAPKSITGAALESNDLLVQTIWPSWFTQVRASPAFSIIGSFYLDSGIFGVILGMFVLGSFLYLLSEYYYFNIMSFNSQLLYSISVPLVIVLFRGTLQDTIARAFFIVVPILFYQVVENISWGRSISVGKMKDPKNNGKIN